jgi:Spy/CpxP family protein refolding chaperone
MKVKNLLTICAVAAALILSAGSIYAQNGNGGGGNGGGGNGGGGGGGRRGGGGGGGNFDPAQMQQRMMDRYRQDLNFTNDAEWSAVQPLVQKVMDARMAVGRGGFGRGGRGGGQGGGGGGFGQPNPERDALQKAIDDNAPAGQIKDLLAKYQASQKARQAKLVAAQADLRKVLTPTQEAQATLSGLLD